MSFEEICEKCTLETRNFLYLFVACIKKAEENIVSWHPYDSSYKDYDIFYWLYLNLFLKNDIATIMRLKEIDENKIITVVPFFVANYLRYTKLENLNIKELSETFNSSNYRMFLYLRSYPFDKDKKLCLERLLSEMINSGFLNVMDIKEMFKLDKIKKMVEVLADSKEKKMTMKEEVLELCSTDEIRKRTPIDLKFGNDLTACSHEQETILGRQKEFRSMCAYLLDDEKSLIIHGNPGVGKTALVKSLASNIIKGTAPKRLQDKRIIEISGTEIVSGCKLIGMLEERLLKILNYCVESGNVILFVDEIHTLMGLGGNSVDNNDVSNILKPYLGDGRVKIVGATTTKEYGKILDDEAFARRFNGLEIFEPSDEVVLEILKHTIKKYEKQKKISIKYHDEMLDELLKLIIKLSKKKNPNAMLQKKLYNPDLALTILRNGYNFAMVDDKKCLDTNSIVEGVMGMDYFRDQAKNEFQDHVLTLTREKPSLQILK